MRLEGFKVLILVGPAFEDLEFWVPFMRLREEGAEVVVAGASANETFTGKHGVPARSDVSFDNVDPNQFDAVIIPGGWAPDKLRRYDAVKNIVRAMYNSQKTIGMICHAGLVGISAGIVGGHPATGSVGIKDDLVNAGAIWRNEPAFRSGNIVWGRVVEDIPNYCRLLVEAFEEQKLKR
jgi:protease I